MSRYADWWDHYVNNVFPKRKAQTHTDLKYPGYEWGDEERWTLLFQNLFLGSQVQTWRHAVEIGPGAGKYTEMVFAHNAACQVYAYDVSQAFLDVCAERLAPYCDDDRLILEHLRADRADELLRSIAERNLVRKLDAFFSIDAMVHVDLQYLIVYLITAGLCLQPGGKLILTLADATSDPGFEKLLRGIRAFFSQQSQPTPKFEFLSPDLVSNVLRRLGFRIDYLENGSLAPEQQGRDLHVIASLVDPHKADALEDYLRPA